MSHRCFDIAIADGIAHLILSRGDAHNSMTADFWRELPLIVREIDEGAKARVLVLSSTGKHFCTGMDMSVLAGAGAPQGERGRARAQLREVLKGLQESFNALEAARLPVLAAIQGGCIGAALDMIAACDCRYATEDAFFVMQEINLGMVADVGSFPRLCRLMPEGPLREFAFTGQKMPAARAKDLGLVNAVFATQDEMLAHVMGVAKAIAAKSPLAVFGTKVMLNYARDHSTADTLDYVATWQAGMLSPDTDIRESVAAKSEKRTASYAELLPVKKGL